MRETALESGMKILQIGAPRSGNFWLWRILQAIIDRAELPNGSVVRSHPVHRAVDDLALSHDRQSDIDMIDILPSRTVWRISSVWRMPLEDVGDYIDRVDHVWTHSRFCDRSPEVFREFDRIVYICRDPRDRALSSARFAFTPYMRRYYPHGEPDPETWLDHRYGEHLRDWKWHVFDHLRYRRRFDIHFVFYEQLLHDFDRALADLLTYLGVDLSASARESIRRAVAFENMNRRHPDHVRRGQSEKWRDQLDGARLRRAAEIAGSLMDLLGYPRGSDGLSVARRPPSASEDLDRSSIEARIR